MKNRKFTNIEKFVIICAVVFFVMMVGVFALEAIESLRGISDIFSFFLGLLAVSLAYLFRKSLSKLMFVFFTVCGGLIALLSLIEQILVILE